MDGRVDNFEQFKNHVQAHFDDSSRLDNAFKMLKKDRFQLFAEVTDKGVTGVVKSQTDPDLVYACSLTANGKYSCGTQNLRACGGLRGALCKHILVLMIGLARSNEIPLLSATKWILASIGQEAAPNKPMWTDVFLKYKGAESGDIDWRPTETMPEDYYAF